MKILWMTWKDRKNPLAGGAETVNKKQAKRLVADYFVEEKNIKLKIIGY